MRTAGSRRSTPSSSSIRCRRYLRVLTCTNSRAADGTNLPHWCRNTSSVWRRGALPLALPARSGARIPTLQRDISVEFPPFNRTPATPIRVTSNTPDALPCNSTKRRSLSSSAA